ncbi:MAG: tRNA 2-thiouridine(34) synthase MnmA [Verrucomicrobia bacterium]|nr:MAG: tRNA 2-thiouridine(34) synthase MnmA [Verrucomicrobiota bacterium]
MSTPLTIAVGMSGGVDSTVTAWRLKRAGHNVVGLTMQIWDGSVALPDEGRSGCYGPGEARDLAAARAAAEQLGIRHITVPLAGEYKNCVLDYFREEYRSGRTPNPCVVCNQRMKFGLLLEKARAQGIAFDKFATGHYARIVQDPQSGLFRLLRGVDPQKDQSYFIARLTQEQLRQTLFPLGALRKPEVVQMAREAGFGDIAEKEESQDFIESEDYSPLFQPGESKPGPIVDTTGKVLGQHRGIIHYTIGQREGLGVAAAERLYVKELRAATNTIVLGRRDEVFSDGCRIEKASWISGTPPATGTTCLARLRYRHTGVQATLHCESEDVWRTDFAEPQFAVTPGQAAVFYHGDEVLGGGWIEK